MNILITGAAGFIGFHLSKKILQKGHKVFGVDDLNAYYEVKLKKDRLKKLSEYSNFFFKKTSISNYGSLKNIFKKNDISHVINLAAYAGVRHSIKKPQDYIDANITGFNNILRLSEEFELKHLIYASSSSVYGTNTKIPFHEDDNVDHPVSLYGATKKSNELMAHCYSHLFDLPTTGLRFFTVYGPWGRPDMALFKFTKAIISNKPMEIYNHGKHNRDFTYIDDIVDSIIKLLNRPPKNKNKSFNFKKPKASESFAPYTVYNIGNNETVSLMEFVRIIEKAVGKKGKIKYMNFQLGDVETSFSDTTKLQKKTGFKPYTPLEKGIKKFVDWYKEYYKV